jgi:hypothetical protein
MKDFLRSVNLSYSRGPMNLWSNGQGYDVSLPIIDVKKDYLKFEYHGQRPVYMADQSKLIVRGRSWIRSQDGTYIDANYEKRWCTIPAQDVAYLLKVAEMDGTIRDMRMLSKTAGISLKTTQNTEMRMLGTEPALLVQLDGSDEAHALAERYSFNHQVQRMITLANETQMREVTYVNALIISKAAADAALGINTYPNEERVAAIAPGTDVENPNWEDAISQARAVGRLPERQKRSY